MGLNSIPVILVVQVLVVAVVQFAVVLRILHSTHSESLPVPRHNLYRANFMLLST